MATLVGDSNEKAYDRLTYELNLPGYPCLYYDGGAQVVVGPPGDTMAYRTPLLECGERPAPDLGLALALEHLSGTEYRIACRVTNELAVNNPPAANLPQGPTTASLDLPAEFQSNGDDADHDRLYYQWSWGDGDTTAWLGSIDYDSSSTATHAWTSEGDFQVQVRCRDLFGLESDWSSPLTVSVIASCCQVRGDINDDGIGPDIADLVYLVTYMFQTGPEPPCFEAADINGDGTGPDIADLVYLVTYMFQTGPPPVPCP